MRAPARPAHVVRIRYLRLTRIIPGRRFRSDKPPLDAAPVMSDEPMPDNGVFDGAYFVKLARTGRVRPEAPCVISYGGAGVCVRRILEVQPSVLIVEMVSEDPDAPKVSATGTRVRIPLEKIEKVILSQDVANDKDEP